MLGQAGSLIQPEGEPEGEINRGIQPIRGATLTRMNDYCYAMSNR